ncbi:MAG: NAD-dependent epimerase/dehydratase family protein [candidate division WS1 bacterium]|jgi:UDP-glucuronate 4-epimerase|nr:NAD-dependent epimerase/dehydratase family protein [candidate division WS1 bacterium]
MSERTIVVTGAAGFIASHLSEALVARGDRVIGIDNFDPYYDPAIKRRNIEGLLKGDRFRLIESDIRDPEAVSLAFADAPVSGVVHLAARAGVRPSIEQPVDYCTTNVEGTAVLLEAAREAGVPRFVFGSSSSVYGAANEVPFDEDQRIDRPISPYAATKVAGEAMCYTWHHLYDMPIVVLRFFTVFGPRQRPDLAINKFVRLLEAGEPIQQFGDGSSSRDYTFAGDIVRGIIAALDSDLQYDIINLGGSSPVTLSELIAAVAEAVGVEPQIEVLPDQPGDVPRTYASVEKARRLLGWQAQISLAEGLRQFVTWHREQQV